MLQLTSNNSSNNKCIGCCSWKCLCLSSSLTVSIIILIFSIILFVTILPNFAQNTLDHAVMDIINGTLYNATNSSISLNTSILVSNAGMFDGTLHESIVTVYSNDIKIGTMKMPKLQTIGNRNSVLTMMSLLNIENITQFQKSCKALLKNKDQIWRLTANDVKLTVYTNMMGIAFDLNVNINKDLILPGANLYDFIASSFNVDSASINSMTTSSDMNFISKSIFKFILPAKILMSVYFRNEYIGYVPLNDMTMNPGLNIMRNQSLIIESNETSSNRKLLNIFFSEYIMGQNQNVTMRGPAPLKSAGYDEFVIDGIFDETVIALGYTAGTLAFGGLITSVTQQGYTVKTTGQTVRGAYSNFLNPLNVPIRIVNLSANAYLKNPIKYDVTLLLVDTYQCKNTTNFGHLHIGAGIYKEKPDQTWVDVDANAKSTFFSIAEPIKESGDGMNSLMKDECLDLYPFSCCFATLTTAYICSLNPALKNDKNGQLDIDYLPLELESNITMLIDNKFNITTYYKQSFFPLFFGYQVYGGYIKDSELSCSDFKFY